MSNTAQQENEQTRAAWNANAAFWDARMGDAGNDFVNELIWPAAQRLLQIQPGERVLDVACGNGLYARRLAHLSAEVVAFDFAAELIERAQAYALPTSSEFSNAAQPAPITYHVLDATNEAALLTLGEKTFDAAFCSMALMDIADIAPLMRALARLLRSGGRFVFATAHPCFNHSHVTHVAEMQDREGEIVTTYGVKITGYMTPGVARGAAIAGQPEPQLYFHRPLHQLLGVGFTAGFVLDALDERAFTPENQPRSNPLGWSGRFSEIPPVLLARMRLPETATK